MTVKLHGATSICFNTLIARNANTNLTDEKQQPGYKRG